MTIDRTPKPCLHKIARHQHGERVTYTLDGCRCLPCCYAISVYELDRQKRNAYGRSTLIDAAPAREHIALLMAADIGLKRIVVVGKVPQGVLWKLVYGKKRPDGTMVPSKRITRATAARLLALDPSDPNLLADGALVDSTGARRRLQALTCLGWSVERLAAESGVDRQALDQALRGGLIRARHARRVATLYEQLWDQRAPATDHRERISAARAINRATAGGWWPPAAWDDDTIDDPAFDPTLETDDDVIDELAIEAVLDGERLHLTGRDLDVAVERLAGRGLPASRIAERVGTYPEKVIRILREAAA